MVYPNWGRGGAGGTAGGGLFTGSAGSFSGLPNTRVGGSALVAGDAAALTVDDGLNLKGGYVWDGSAWVYNYPFSGSTTIPNFLTNTPVAAGEPRIIRGKIYTSNSARTTGATLSDAELAFWTPRFQYSDVRTIDGTGPVNLVTNNAITYTDSNAGAFTLNLDRSAGDADGLTALIVVTDSTATVTLAATGTISGVTSIPAGTPIGTTYQVTLIDGGAEDWSVQQLGSGGVDVTEMLTIVAPNTINNLSDTPASDVDFYINGLVDLSGGITNSGNIVTVNPAVLGFNIAVTDSVSAEYST